jgi:(p)ppGpp synthase/HD superfamily hydrolase
MALAYLSGIDQKTAQRLTAAHRFAVRHLSHLKRRSGRSYAENGVEVATVLREVTDDPALIATALLHDLLMHPNGERLLQESPLTPDERLLVARMHSLRRLNINVHTKDLERVMNAFLSEPRLLPLRMAHRVSDIRHLKRFAPTVQRGLARETLHMYAAIAGRLGMHAWRREMEDTCFELLKPDAAKSLRRQFALHAKNDRQCLTHMENFLKKKLATDGIRGELKGRTKTLYSTYCKMVIKHRKFEDLTDRLAMRIIVPKIDDCYRALGVVHRHLRPMPGKLKDYIGAPKENGYRSIHTVVFPLPGVTEYPVEVQIRTLEIHQECEYGLARHADYKQLSYAIDTSLARVDLYRNLQTLHERAHSPGQFEQALRTYFQENHISVFDAKGNLYHLPAPVSALDFVCRVMPDRLTKLAGVRINGRNRGVDTLLKDGDAMEPQFGVAGAFKKDWIKACRQQSSQKICEELFTRPSTARASQTKRQHSASVASAHASANPRKSSSDHRGNRRPSLNRARSRRARQAPHSPSLQKSRPSGASQGPSTPPAA